MKNYFAKTLLLGFLFLSSCSSDDKKNTPLPPQPVVPEVLVLPTEVKIETTNLSTNITTLVSRKKYEYNGNKLSKIVNLLKADDYKEYTYAGDLISRVQEFNNNIITNYTNYFYENGKNIRKQVVNLTNKSINDYTYDYSEFDTKKIITASVKNMNLEMVVNNQSKEIYHYDAAMNLIKAEYVGQYFTPILGYTYDDKKGFDFNIVGFNKIVGEYLGPNNRIKLSSSNVSPLRDYTYEYNDKSYPSKYDDTFDGKKTTTSYTYN